MKSFEHLLKSLNWREKNARSKEEPADELCAAYRAFLAGETCKDTDSFKAVRVLRDTKGYRDQLESMLLAEMCDEECASYFDIDASIVSLYKKLFFDLDLKASPAEYLTAALEQIGTGSSYKQIARRFGKVALLFALGYKIDPSLSERKRLKSRLEFTLLLHANQLELLDPSDEKLSRYLLQATQMYIKMEGIRSEASVSDLQKVIGSLKDIVEMQQNRTRRTRQDLGI